MKFNVRHGGFTLILLLLGLPAYAGGGGGTSLITTWGYASGCSSGCDYFELR